MATLTRAKAHMFAIRIGVRERELKKCEDKNREKELKQEIEELVKLVTTAYGPEEFFKVEEELHTYLKKMEEVDK